MPEMPCSDLDVATLCASNSVVNRYYRYALTPRFRFGLAWLLMYTFTATTVSHDGVTD